MKANKVAVAKIKIGLLQRETKILARSCIRFSRCDCWKFLNLYLIIFANIYKVCVKKMEKYDHEY